MFNPRLPTSAPGGSEEKIRILSERARLEIPLFHPQDNPHALPQQRQEGTGNVAGRPRGRTVPPGVRWQAGAWIARAWDEQRHCLVLVGIYDDPDEAAAAVARWTRAR